MSRISRTLRVVCCTAVIAAVTVGAPAAPASASTTTVDCSGGGSFSIVGTIVTGSVDCIGDVVIPNSVTAIGEKAFSAKEQDSAQLTSVTFQANSVLTSIGGEAFEGATGLTSIVIPKSVTSIGFSAFFGSGLTSATFEAGSVLETIEAGAFMRSSSLTSVTFGGDAPPTVQNFAFNGVASGATANISSTASGFGENEDTWNGLIVEREAAPILSALTPEFGTPSRTADGFTVDVTNYDDAFTWAVDGPGAALDGSTVTVSDVAAGVQVTVTVTTQRHGYDSGSAQVTGAALEGALTPAFATPVATADGFTVNVTNYDADFTWAVDGSGAALDGATLSVTGAASGVGVTVTVTTQRDGYDSGSAQVTGAALEGALTPAFATPVATADGFTVDVTNFAGDFTWAAVVDGGSVVVGDASGATLPLTVTGVAPGVEVTVTVTTQRAVYDSGSATVTGSALERVVAVAGAPSVTCSPLPAQVGALVTCTVTGGDAGSEILWRAAFNPAFASEGVTLDASGSGQFTFVVPAAALGEVLTVELVGWTAPVSLGVSSGPVPTSVPSGEGPVPVWPVGLLVLAGGLVLRSASRAPRLMPSTREG